MTSVKQWIGGALVIAASVWVGTAIPQSGSPAPVRFDREKIGGLNLTAIAPDVGSPLASTAPNPPSSCARRRSADASTELVSRAIRLAYSLRGCSAGCASA